MELYLRIDESICWSALAFLGKRYCAVGLFRSPYFSFKFGSCGIWHGMEFGPGRKCWPVG